MRAYRDLFARGEYQKAQEILDKSDLKEDGKSRLLWHLEKGTLALNLQDWDGAITHFQQSLDLIDELYTKRLTAKAAALFVNDASDLFYGSSYERSYAHYFLAKSYYQRYLQTANRLDLQGARAAILAWDSYFSELQRSATTKTLYHTDLMLKVFGGEVHEVSGVRQDRQIALQLYKDALQILERQGGIFSLFNAKHAEYVKEWASAIDKGKFPAAKFYEKTPAYYDLQELLHYKILSLTKEIRSGDYAQQVKTLSPSKRVLDQLKQGKGNVVLVFEEGLIPSKVGKPFNFGIRGAIDSVDDSKTKQVIATVGVGVLTAFAMNQLGLVPTQNTGPGAFLFGYEVTKVAVHEAAIQFELPMIEDVPLVQRLEYFVMDDKGVVVQRGPLPVVSENGSIARVVLEEDVVSRYTRTGVRIAIKHLVAIAAALGIYQKLKDSGEFIAKPAALATYVAGSRALTALEQADTRHWRTLPQALRMTELNLKPGLYKIGLGLYSGTTPPEGPSKMLQEITVGESGKVLHTLSFSL